jgi:PAS domain S-box-containing protein
MDRLKKLLNQPSVRVVLVYIVFSAIWIAFTDRIVEQFYTDPSTIRQVQTIKGWLFVLASGGVLIWVIKITGRQLEINRDQYKTMLGDANIGIARLENMKMVSSNPAFRNILGRNSREQAELTFFEFIDEHARHGFREAVKSLENQKTIQQELKIKLTRNKRRWVQINISKHKDQEGEYHQVILQDINDRKTYQAYADLLLKVMLTLEPTDNFKAGLRGILNNLCMELNWEYGVAFTPGPGGEYQKQVSWYRLDPLFDEFDSKVEGYSFKSGEGLTGLTAREKKSIWIENLETDQRFMYREDAIDADLHSAVSVPVVVSTEVIAILILFSREPLDSDEGLIKLLTAVGHDIGVKLEKRKQQDEKEKLERSLNFALKSASMATWDMDLETGNMIRSQNHHELFGFDRAPKTWNVDDLTDTILEEDRENVTKHLYEAVFETKGFNAEFRVKKNGSIRWLWSRGDLQYDNFGEPERLSGVVTDITKRKQFQIFTELLLEIFLSIEPLKDLHIAYENILKVICKKNIWQYGEIWQSNMESGKSECTHTWFHPDDKLLKSFGSSSKGKILEAGEGIPGSGKYSNELLWMSDIRKEKSFSRRTKAAKAGLKSAVSIPLGVDEEPVATMLLFTKYQMNQDEDTVNFLNAIRNNLGMKLARKKAAERLENYQRELQDERTRFEAIATLTNDVIYDHDIASEHFWASEGIYSIMGYDPGKYPVAIEWWKENLHPDDRERMTDSLAKTLDSESNEWKVNYRFFGAGGAEKHIIENALILRDEKNKPVRMLGAMIDVTAEKKAERALRDSEEQYRRLFDQNPYPMWIYDPKTLEILQVNQAMIQKYGYTEKEFESLIILDLTPPEEAVRLKKELKKKLEGLRDYQGVTHLKKDGSKLIVDVTSLDIRYKGDQKRLVVINDITRQKRAEEKIIGSVIEGSENERRRIAKELHDGLGQYLTAASMNLDSVYEELNSLPEVKWNQYEKGLKLLRNAIVESRRISQNLLPKAIEDFGLSLAVQSLVDDFSDSFDAGISYSDNLGDIKLTESVELNIYRIIQEALNNAARHSGCTRIDIQLILDDHQLICTIEDNGRGFDYSSESDRGLGLASFRNRVNALSGELEISTGKGKGTLVSVIIPVKTV